MDEVPKKKHYKIPSNGWKHSWLPCRPSFPSESVTQIHICCLVCVFNLSRYQRIFLNRPSTFQQVYTKQNPNTYCGAQGGLSLHSEPAANHRSHRAMITVSGGSPDKLNAIQVGWTVTIITHFRSFYIPLHPSFPQLVLLPFV